MKNIHINLAIQTGVFLLLAAFYTQLGGMPEEAKGYPTFLLAACAVVNASILFSDLRNLRGEEAVEKDPAAPAMIRRVILYIVVLGIRPVHFAFLCGKPADHAGEIVENAGSSAIVSYHQRICRFFEIPDDFITGWNLDPFWLLKGGLFHGI